MGYLEKIEQAKNIQELFSTARDLVQEHLGVDQAGLMLGLSDLGINEQGFIGAFYAPHANMIVVNKRPLQRILQKKPQWYNSYLFHVLLHEYIHAIGIYDEQETRNLVYLISKHHFGDEHLLCHLAKDLGVIRKYVHSQDREMEPMDTSIEFLHGVDRRNTNYIQ